MSMLRIVCTGHDGGRHAPRELARIEWQPEIPETGSVVWSADTPLKDMPAIVPRESARSTRGGKASRHVKHAPVEVHTRADGGTTWTTPPCPKCRRPGVELRDTTLRRYLDQTRNTQLEDTLDVSYMHVIH